MKIWELVGRTRTLRTIWLIEGGLLLVLLGSLGWLWSVLPVDGVKLHGNVDTGVNLLGTRNDMLWLGMFGVLVWGGNTVLAWVVARRDPAASFFLIGTILPVLVILIGGVIFLAHLNRVF